MKWIRRFHTTGHSGAAILAAGMGVGSIHKYLEDGLATAVILEALRDLKDRAEKAAQDNDEWFTPWEYTSHPGGGEFGKRDFLRALDEQITIHEKRQSDIWSGFMWARVLNRRHQEEVAELIIKSLRPDVVV